jgi:hypothetical protein
MGKPETLTRRVGLGGGLWCLMPLSTIFQTTEAGRDHKETVLTSLHCTYYPFITTIIININSQCI